jgi:hypothetical protein
MKVNELIELLSAMPQDLEIMVASGAYLDNATVIDEISKLYIDDDGEVYLSEDAQKEPNALCIYGVV